MRRRAWIASLLLLVATRAQAEPPLPLELEWHAPAECPSAADVRAELERIARVRAGFELSALKARANVTRQGTAYVLELLTEHDGQQGERELAAPECRTLVRTLTLVLALTYGTGLEVNAEPHGAGPADDAPSPAASGLSTGVQPAPASDTTGKRSEEPRAPVANLEHADVPAQRSAEASPNPFASAPGPARAPRLAWMLGAGAQLGLMPAAAFFASVGAELYGSAWSVAARATAWPGVSSPVTSRLDARFAGLGAELQGCGRTPLASLTLAMCGIAWAGALRGRASGSAQDKSATAPWYALGGATSVTWPRGRWLSLRLEAQLAASLDRPRFVIENLGSIHRVPAFVADLGASLIVSPL